MKIRFEKFDTRAREAHFTINDSYIEAVKCHHEDMWMAFRNEIEVYLAPWFEVNELPSNFKLSESSLGYIFEQDLYKEAWDESKLDEWDKMALLKQNHQDLQHLNSM